MKKVIAFSLVCLILLVAFAGCSSSKSTATKTSTPTVTETATPIETEIEAISTNIATITSTATKTATPTSTKTVTKTKTLTPTLTKTATPTSTKSSTSVVCSCSSDQYNCGDFSTWSAAQACYDYCMSTVGRDVHGLDRDKDGCACESNSGCNCG